MLPLHLGHWVAPYVESFSSHFRCLRRPLDLMHHLCPKKSNLQPKCKKERSKGIKPRISFQKTYYTNNSEDKSVPQPTVVFCHLSMDLYSMDLPFMDFLYFPTLSDRRPEQRRRMREGGERTLIHPTRAAFSATPTHNYKFVRDFQHQIRTLAKIRKEGTARGVIILSDYG